MFAKYIQLKSRSLVSVPANSVRFQAVNRVIGVVGLLAGVFFLLGGGFFLHRMHFDEFFFKRAVAHGRVLENRSKQISPKRNGRSYLPFVSYYAIVQFQSREGRTITYSDVLGFSTPSFRVGQDVIVFYDPEEPQHAMIDRGAKNYVIPGICLIFGGLMVLGSCQRLARSRIC
jgi:hypothetical protein